jgi:DNA topoisomerase I
MDGEQITLEQAIALLNLPRVIGMHPETHEAIEAGIGRFGPFVRMGAIYTSLDRDDDVLAVGLNRAVDLVARKMASVRTVGLHPADQQPVAVRKGRFGPFVQHGNQVANLPRGTAMEDVTLDDALELLAEKGKTLKPRGAAARKRVRGRQAAKDAAPASTPVESPTRKKAATKKKKAAVRGRAAKPKRAAPSRGKQAAE